MISYLILGLLALRAGILLHKNKLVNTLGINLSDPSFDSGAESAPYMVTLNSGKTQIEDGDGSLLSPLPVGITDIDKINFQRNVNQDQGYHQKYFNVLRGESTTEQVFSATIPNSSVFNLIKITGLGARIFGGQGRVRLSRKWFIVYRKGGIDVQLTTVDTETIENEYGQSDTFDKVPIDYTISRTGAEGSTSDQGIEVTCDTRGGPSGGTGFVMSEVEIIGTDEFI